MRQVPTEQFLDAVASCGVGLDPRYAPPQTVEHLAGAAKYLKIDLPDNVGKLATIVDAAFDLLPSASDLWIYKRQYPWVPSVNDDRYRDRAVNGVLRGLGIESKPGALLLNSTERELAAGICFLMRPISWNVAHDLFVLPSNGEIILYFDHHDTIHISCRDNNAYEALSVRLASLSVQLDVE